MPHGIFSTSLPLSDFGADPDVEVRAPCLGTRPRAADGEDAGYLLHWTDRCPKSTSKDLLRPREFVGRRLVPRYVPGKLRRGVLPGQDPCHAEGQELEKGPVVHVHPFPGEAEAARVVDQEQTLEALHGPGIEPETEKAKHLLFGEVRESVVCMFTGAFPGHGFPEAAHLPQEQLRIFCCRVVQFDSCEGARRRVQAAEIAAVEGCRGKGAGAEIAVCHCRIEEHGLAEIAFLDTGRRDGHPLEGCLVESAAGQEHAVHCRSQEGCAAKGATLQGAGYECDVA
jgi:hypothetical protein